MFTKKDLKDEMRDRMIVKIPVGSVGIISGYRASKKRDAALETAYVTWCGNKN